MTASRGGEFFVAMTADGGGRLAADALVARRQHLLRATMRESAQQIRLARSGGLLGRDRGLVPDLILTMAEKIAHHATLRLEALFGAKPVPDAPSATPTLERESGASGSARPS